MSTTIKRATKKSEARNVEALLDQLGIVIATTGREITCHCPFHEDRHPSFSINADKGLWICYQCGASGNLERLLSDVGGDTNPTKSLREIKSQRVKQSRVRPVGTEPEDETPDPYYLYARYESFASPPQWALEERFIAAENAEHYGLRWKQGWIIPIWGPHLNDPVEDLWGWQFKRLDFVSNYPRRIKKSMTLFGLAQLDGERRAVLVESPLDVVRLASVGVPAVASYGAMVSKYQMGLLEARLDRLTLALDNDKEGKEQTERIYPVMARRLPTRVLSYPEHRKDLGEATDDEIEVIFDL